MPHTRALEGFHGPVRAWFRASYGAPTRVQALGWPAIRAGGGALLLAPTGSGKTLAAFLVAIDRLMFEAPPASPQRCRVLYISPLKALAVDVERNLRAPLVGILRAAEENQREGAAAFPLHEPTVAIRTGDTPGRERAAFVRRPADFLVTTPESLYLLLTSAARETLRSVRQVIVDEIHALVGTKRGAHLAVSLERVEELTGAPLQRIGLSATVRPVDEAARFLGGFDNGGVPRCVTIVDAGNRKALDLTVAVPVDDMAKLGRSDEIPDGPAAGPKPGGSIWPAIHPMLLDLIRAHRSTLLFVNSRRLAERLTSALNELAGEDLVRAHHGSIAREARAVIEDDLKSGRLPALVATSSLELGIDMGAIDLVIQVESPPSVASALQRIGRAGHQVDAPSKGVIVPKFRGDLVAAAALTAQMRAGVVESIRYLRNPLDVLAQHIVAMAAVEEWEVERLHGLIKRSAPFAALPRSAFESTLDMLSGRFASAAFGEHRPRLVWDRLEGTLRAREGARRIAVTSGGTIPDRGLYGVYLPGAEGARGRLGELDEEMVFETRVGDTFLLGASTWRVEEITHDRVIVSPAPGVPGKMPFWRGERAGRTLEFGRAIGALTRKIRSLPEAEAVQLLREKHDLDARAAANLLQYLREQAAATGAVPDDRTIVVERYLDEMGDWRVCILSPFGGRVHAPWALAIGMQLRRGALDEGSADVLWTDDGIVARVPEAEQPPPVEPFLPDPDEVEALVTCELGAGGERASGQNPLFAARFREAAARALLLPRRAPGRRSPLWQQRKRAAELLAAASQYPSFPILLEAYRECLQDVFDLPALIEVLRAIRSRTIRVVTADTRVPSPFASALLFSYVGNFIYDGDAPLAELRAQALTVDPARLRELLGQADLRELLDPDAITALEQRLQGLDPERYARHPDAVHDLLLRLGDLTREELRARSDPAEAADEWIANLTRERRIFPITVAGEERFVAAEDAARYRDALGAPPPPGLPGALLEGVADPLGDLVARYARTRGPFRADEAAARLGIGPAPVVAVLRGLEAGGRLLEGEFRPGGAGREFCDADVLRALRQRSLARLRHEAEPVRPETYARLLLAWQGADHTGVASTRGIEALHTIVENLQGAAIPASVLESQVLPARVGDYRPEMLDELTSAGSVLWVGREPLGPHDGRVSLYRADHAALLLSPQPSMRPDGPLHGKIREHLTARGASFFPQIQASTGGFFRETLEALWDLVWAGEVTNDTLRPLRALIRARTHLRQRAADLPPEASGRWSLVRSYGAREPSPEERQAALAKSLLDRYGILVREAVHAERLPGGWAALYPVLRAMEEAGRIRRGYFIEGLGAAQFAMGGALDRLRALREVGEDRRTLLLAATDPANPYGAALPWPERATARKPARIAGAVVVLVDGELVAWMARNERQLLAFVDKSKGRDAADLRREIALTVAASVGARGRRALLIGEVDGAPAAESHMAVALREAGFVPTSRGLLKRLGG
jgi:ATP-dependent Lhr-like helicase